MTEENICCIPLLCIENVYVENYQKDKYENLWFFFNTASEKYTIKCNSDLDYDLWINSLIHSTNLAKEANILKERSKKIEQVQTFLFDLISKNSIFDSQFVLSDRRQLDRAFSIIEENIESFFPYTGVPKGTLPTHANTIIRTLKNLVLSFLDAKRLKSDRSGQEAFKGKLEECSKYLSSKVAIGESIEITLSQFIDAETNQDGAENSSSEEVYDRISKIIDDLFYNLQRTSVSNNIFLEQYYSRLEVASLNQFEDIIV